MNLNFNIAIHALTFLLKHKGEVISSDKLALLICVNPVQLRKVLSILVQKGYIVSKKGKVGGYSISDQQQDIKLSSLYDLYRNNSLDQRTITGDKNSCCIVSKNISEVIRDLDNLECQKLKECYSKISIQDVLNNIIKKEEK